MNSTTHQPYRRRYALVALSQADDSETVTDADLDLSDFFVVNDMDAEECNAIAALSVGEEHRMGGGAAPLVAVRRIA